MWQLYTFRRATILTLIRKSQVMDPKYQRYADRLRDLVEEGKIVADLPKPSSAGRFIQDKDRVVLHAWLTKVLNIITVVFGTQSPHFVHLATLTTGSMTHSYEIYPVVGLIEGALDDLEKGYLLGQEFFIAGDIFDSVLEQAKNLNQNVHRDPAAILARVVLENALKRLARREGLDDNQKASRLNDELKRIGIYPQPQWRLIQAWLDIGNAAAHGRFDEYNEEDVQRLLKDIEAFLAARFRA
jgi:hypothetical protein